MKISPSTLDAISVCPTFEYKPYIKDSGGAADEGLLLHKSLETGETDELTEEQIRCVNKTHELCESLKTSFLDWDNSPIKKRIELHEQKLTGSFGLRGLMDRAYVNLHVCKALVVDMKSGRAGLLREAADSLQMAAYADLIFTRLNDSVQEIMVVLSSPRTNEVSSHIYKFEDWKSIQERIKKVMDDANYPFKVPKFSDALCPKCRYLTECPAAMKTAIVPTVDTKVAFPTHLLLKPVDTLTVEEIAITKAALDLLEAWIDQRKPMVDERIFSEGLEIPGYAKVSRDSAPFVPVEKTGRAWDLLKDMLTPEEFLAACGKISLTRLVDRLADTVPGATLKDRKDAAREFLFDRIEEVVEKSKPSTFMRRKAKLDMTLLIGG